MKKFLQSAITLKLENQFSNAKEKALTFINSHPEIFCVGVLTIACLIFLFFGLGFYPLIDVDETRYAVMARDLVTSFGWNELMLNNVPFLEKPPLYFWLVASSIKLFGEFTSWVVRFPIALISAFLVFFTYYVGKRIISRKFGVISALVLLSSAFFLILSHIAIIDMVLTVFMTSALYCALLTQFCEDKNKKYYWWYFYLFVGLGFLSKGILALAIPVVVVFLFSLATKTLKEVFKPINFVPGLIIFLTIVTPWHAIMYKQYGFQFVKEYFLIHHFGRFMGSEYIGRVRPIWFFIPVFLLGFMPWTFVFLATLVKGTKSLVAKYKAAEGKVKEKLLSLVDVTTNEQKLMLFSVINFVVIFALFSSSGTKLPTYILPIFPAASFLTGYYWWMSDEKSENQNTIYNSTLLFSALFILIAFGASVAYFFLPQDIQSQVSSFKEPTLVCIYLLAVLLVLRLSAKRALSVFSGYVFTMVFVVTLAVSQIFNLVYAGGENEIVDYSLISSAAPSSSQLVTFDFAVKPSVLIKGRDVVFLTEPDFESLDQFLNYKAGPTFVIVKNKNLANNDKYAAEIEKRLELFTAGKKYSLYVKVPECTCKKKRLAIKK